MKKCSEYAEQISMYIDGMLPPEEADELMEHLERCENCQKRYESLRIITAEMHEMNQLPPHGMHDSIMRYVRKNGQQARRNSRSRCK